MNESRKSRWQLIGLCLLLPSLIFAIGTYVSFSTYNASRPIAWWEIVIWALIRWYVWIAIFPFVLWLGQNLPFDSRRNIAVHLAASVLFSAMLTTIQASFRSWAGWTPQPLTFSQSFTELMFRRFHWHVFGYWLVTGISQALIYYRYTREHKQKSEELETKLAGIFEQVRTDEQFLDRFSVKTGNQTIFIETAEIDWIESYGNYVRLHIGDKKHLLRETLSNMEASLSPKQFFRIHRTSLVNIIRIKELKPQSSGACRVVLHNGNELNLSRRYRRKLQRSHPDLF